MRDAILILDYGSQYTQLIARRVRELGVYSEIHPFDWPLADIRRLSPRGIILSGGPASVYEPGAPTLPPYLLEVGVPVLGICYGAQLLVRSLGGEVIRAAHHEYGRAQLRLVADSPLFHGFARGEEFLVWMSHGDRVATLPEGFVCIGETDSCPAAAIANEHRRLYGVQFHPEVVHTPRGIEMLQNFCFRLCHAQPSWSMAALLPESIRAIQTQIGTGRALCAISGGVDSAVAAALVHRAVGDRLSCIFVDNGLLRHGERSDVEELLRLSLGAELHVVDAQQRFLQALRGVTDPEEKRKRIGQIFIDVFEEKARELAAHGPIDFLVQGTLYPDVIESISHRGPSATIKSHHNVGGLPERMRLRLVEPLRELFKDEVRVLGRELGLPQRLLERHPFPGPGLAVRIVGEVTPARLATLRAADLIVQEEVRAAGVYGALWQAFAVLLPIKSVGVMGDQRTYADTICVRAVHSTDGMTADWAPLPAELLGTLSRRIINEVRGVNRVVYDITSKPPGTIEWE
ncbi:MAG: glutamine-hydrolyzing GMP synthase [Myxococcales bacterium]|nr:glutamine-hydrolyzing GMP synthase [Myxococcota bacterium]MDW8280873.1 glutamine-hydrolyzing GMP synthase [Myxococcales bacterium]